MSSRHTLLELFDAALRAVDGRASVARSLGDVAIDFPADVFAIGKAASGMALGARDVLGDRVRGLLVITKDGHADPALGVPQLEGPHPVPDARSLVLGAELEKRIAELPGDGTPLFLVSGGSSSIVDSLREGVSLDDLRAFNETGLAAGWDIGCLNAGRSRLSKLKAGGVARLLGRRKALALFISDVPGDDVDVIGSGLLGRDGGRDDSIERRIVANAESAADAVQSAGRARGLEIERCAARFAGDATQVAREFVEALRATSADGLVWAGESTVTLPRAAGRGGRNTHLALTAAKLLRANEKLVILAAGTDGTDGPTDDAGAIVDAGTIERAEIGGVDTERALGEFDSGTALEAAQDLVHTGPTGTNVGDLLIGIRAAAAPRHRDLSGSR
jgi:glycerate 2-kinase